MRKMMMAAAAVSALLVGGGADATIIMQNGSVTAAVVNTGTLTQVAMPYSNVAFTSQAPAGMSSTFSGTYSAGVYKDSANTLCAVAGQCLTFVISVTNGSTSADSLEKVTSGPFSALYTYNVGYNADNGGSDAPLSVFYNGNGTMSFNFTNQANPTSNIVKPSMTTDNLIVQSSAMYAGAGNISIQDNQTATVAGFVPTVPEPATWGMMILGMGMVGTALRRRTAGAPKLA